MTKPAWHSNGVKALTGNGTNLYIGRGILWSATLLPGPRPAPYSLWGNPDQSGVQIIVWQPDNGDAHGPRHYQFPMGIPILTGLSSNNEVSLTYTEIT